MTVSMGVEKREQLPNCSTLGATIRALRRHRNMTLVRLGVEADLSHGFLSQLERDLANPGVDSLYRIASALGVRVRDLWPR